MKILKFFLFWSTILAGLDPYLVSQLNPDPVRIRNTGDGYHTGPIYSKFQNPMYFVPFQKEKAVKQKFSPSFLFLLDPGTGMEVKSGSGIRDKRSGSVTLEVSLMFLWLAECPTCRKKLVSKRSLRPDPNFDQLVAKIFPDRNTTGSSSIFIGKMCSSQCTFI
jgi:hypothetical protein